MQFACRADFVEPSLQREAVERIEPEAGEELDARVELPERPIERAPLVFIGANECGRILDAPMGGHRLASFLR